MVRLLVNGTAQETEVCPNCQANWAGEEIFPALRRQDWTATKSDEELMALIEQSYGQPPYRFGRVVGVEYDYADPRHRDGVSAWMCPDCKHVFPRDLGSQTLTQEQVEWKKPSL